MSVDPDPKDLEGRFAPLIRAEMNSLYADSADTAEDRDPVLLDQQSVGRLSRMDAMQGQAMAAAVEARRAQRRQALMAALGRIRDGEFGYCETCGDFIGEARLSVDPVVRLCIGCAR